MKYLIKKTEQFNYRNNKEINLIFLIKYLNHCDKIAKLVFIFLKILIILESHLEVQNQILKIL